MKIFFNISYRSDTSSKNIAKKLYTWLQNSGHLLTYNCFENGVEGTLANPDPDKLTSLYSTAIKALSNSDVVVLEVSTNSFTQGYILQRALEMAKPVIALHEKGKYSIFVKGIKSQFLQTVEYDEFSVYDDLKRALDYATDNLEQKFNVFLPQDINNYLRWAARKKKISKSAFVRDLLREHMTVDKEYLH